MDAETAVKGTEDMGQPNEQRLSYQEKLLDPRWQQMRLKLMEAANWQCEQCGDLSKTLHIHHSFYERGLDPWEYPEFSLHVLCSKCHREAEKKRARLFRVMGLLNVFEDIDRLRGYATGLLVPDASADVTITLTAKEHPATIGFAQSLGLDKEVIYRDGSDGTKITVREIKKMQRIKRTAKQV